MKKIKLFLIIATLLMALSCDGPETITTPIPFIASKFITFNSTIEGEETTFSVVVKNTGKASLTLQHPKLGDTENFSISDVDDKIVIAVGASKTFDVKFTPKKTSNDTFSTTLTFESNDLSGKVVLTLNGPATRPEIKIPTKINFGNGMIDKVETFIIENNGYGILTLKNPDGASIKLLDGTDPSFTLPDTNIDFSGELKICPKDAAEDNPSCAGIPKQIEVQVHYKTVAGDDDGDRGSVQLFVDMSYAEKSVKKEYIGLVGNLELCKLLVSSTADYGDDTIDFGNTYINNNYRKEKLSVYNRGDKACLLNSFEVTDDGAEGDAEPFKIEFLESNPESDLPKTLRKGESFLIAILFKPTEEIAYSGKLKINGEDPMWGETGDKIISLTGVGSTATAPTAICGQGADSDGNVFMEVEPAIDNEANPVSVIALDGTESYPADGLIYKWEKVSAPEGSSALPRNPNAARTSYFVDLGGEHKLKLTVTNQEGVSDSCEVTVSGLTSNALHVELFWDKDGDVDLHVKRPGTTDEEWGTNNDCYFANCVETSYRTAWNGGGWDNPANPHLDRDDIRGSGPENMNIAAPVASNGSFYTIGVKNFSHASNPTATVRIYCNGGIQFEYSASLPIKGKSFWWVANVEWTTTNGCNITPLGSVGDYPGSSWP